ncbi:hypothetical protein EYZ11_012738 [Aspergillus tanneri]|uniref:Uncharacterized protein n=1 Tax=Aspergillus tanneri TaxID=1220188 RepID=A0A4S3J1L2_9EURO|nr:hypothetical protein EYZ11_012738 [Aspergillus tanneri]
MDEDQWIKAIIDKQAMYSPHTAGFALAEAPGDPGKRKQAPWEDKAKESCVIQRHWLNTINIETVLQQITGQETI